jgi:penicillin G amidase
MKKVGVFLKRGLIAIVVLALILGVAGTFYFKSYLPNSVAPKSFPKIDGEIQLDGLNGPVDIYRDQMGIPHIYASTQHDLFFAQGYVHAQDRFWQMDFYRHVGAGRTAEMFGKGQVETDAFLKTLGWRDTAEKEYAAFGAESRAILTAYAEGVNAYLKDHDGEALSLEYAILGLLSPDYAIEPWEPVNTLAWAKALAWDLRSNINTEIERAVLLKTLTAEQVAELFPAYPEDHPLIVNKIGDGTSDHAAMMSTAVDLPDQTLAALQHNASLLDDVLGPFGDGIGSNSWVVSGELTGTGMPLLANDPHLGIAMPSIWYQVDFHCKPKSDMCPYEAAGFSLAGAPGVIIGHNDRIAWGFTFAGEDVMDLFIEKVNPDNPNQYEVNGEWVDFETRQETINVVGGDPVELTVRLTRHGPVISDAYGPLQNEGDPRDKEFVPFRDRAGIDLPQDYVIALSWTALSPSSPFDAVWGFNKAENWDEFREAARNFHVPGQNLAYADVDGNIGYQTSGDIPIRKSGDGALPVPGWTGEYDWTGFIPFEEMPYTFNPVEGYIAPANNKIVGDDYEHLITTDWDYGFRADRIVEMINNAPGKIDIDYFQKMQGDDYDPSAETYVPLLMQMDAQFLRQNEAIAFDLLRDWDYQARADSAAAAVYEAFWSHLLKNTFTDELPERYWPTGGDRWFEVMRKISADSLWWDDKSTTDVVETRDGILKKSFIEAVAELEDMLGKDPAKWKWGDLHAANFQNGTLGQSGLPPLEALFNRGPFPTSGGKSIVNATSWNSAEGYEVTNLPSMRMIVDLSDLNNSVTVHTTGQSGHAYHPHYDDMTPLWANIQYYSMLLDEDEVVAQTEGHLVLTPKETE